MAVLAILQKRSKVQMVMSKSHGSLMTFRLVPSALPSGKAAFTSEVAIHHMMSTCEPLHKSKTSAQEVFDCLWQGCYTSPQLFQH